MNILKAALLGSAIAVVGAGTAHAQTNATPVTKAKVHADKQALKQDTKKGDTAAAKADARTLKLDRQSLLQGKPGAASGKGATGAKGNKRHHHRKHHKRHKGGTR